MAKSAPIYGNIVLDLGQNLPGIGAKSVPIYGAGSMTKSDRMIEKSSTLGAH